MTRIFFLVAVTSLSITIIFSQEPPPLPIEWGEISKNDLQMKMYAPDSNASAVILCDYGETKMNDYMNLVYTRHLRVKILNQKGFEWGTHSVVLYNNRNDGETIDDIEAVTYFLGDDGDIEEVEFDDDDVFEERVDDNYTRYKFTLPGLRPGCVIELRYEITARNFFRARNWVFQYSEPVMWSEYRLQHPVNIGFTLIDKGFEKFELIETHEVLQFFTADARAYLGRNLVPCVLRRFAVKNLPALRDEPFITTMKDYYNKVDIQFSGYATRMGLTEHVINTWESFIEELMTSSTIGKRVEITGEIEDLVESITEGVTTDHDKMRALYSWVTRSIVWTEWNTYAADNSVNTILENKKGSSGEITLLLVSMLRAAGIQAEPVILSTRENGKIQTLYPIYRQFNYLIARAHVDKKTVLLDATNPTRPYYLLPAKILGVQGLVIQPNDKVEWIEIYSPSKTTTKNIAHITIQDDGSAHGTIEGLYSDYASANLRDAMNDKKDIAVAKDYFATDESGMTIDSVRIAGKDSIEGPITITAWTSAQEFGQPGNDLLYINPHVINRWNDNPFKSATRKFPVDYLYPREYITEINLALPAGYQMKEGLVDRELNVAGVVKYRRSMTLKDHHVQINTKFEIVQKEIPPVHYQKLKNLYASMISMESEQLVLQKIPTALPEQSKETAPMGTKK